MTAQPDDAAELLTFVGTVPVCLVLIMERLGWSGMRMKDALHAVREQGFRLITTDRETVRLRRADYRRALDLASRYVERSPSA